MGKHSLHSEEAEKQKRKFAWRPNWWIACRVAGWASGGGGAGGQSVQLEAQVPHAPDVCLQRTGGNQMATTYRQLNASTAPAGRAAVRQGSLSPRQLKRADGLRPQTAAGIREGCTPSS